MELLIEQIIEAVGGECLNDSAFGNNLIRTISIDSRNIQENTLFVPIKGERFDGHGYIDCVFEKGAIATLTQEENVIDERLCTIYVKDTKQALLQLASFYRKLFDIPIIAVTGSVGKTSTKDLIAATLSGKFKVHKTEGNFNNEIGLPLTLFGINANHDVAVVEMGMNHFNEIHQLSIAACPNIAVITNIGVSHIENLGSREGILKAKLEILDGLSTEGLLIVNGDDPLLKSIENIAFTPVTYGRNQENTYSANHISSLENEMQATIITPKETYPIVIPTLGEHMVDNSLVAIAIAEYLGLTKEEILVGMSSYVPSKMRMNKVVCENNLTLIDDTYNASPDSMNAAIKVLSNLRTSGKKIAVLGDMFEMGAYGPSLHEQVGTDVARYQIDALYTIGELAKYIGKGVKEHTKTIKTKHYDTQEAFLQDIKQIVSSGDNMLFKASRGMHFEKLVDAVRKVNFK